MSSDPFAPLPGQPSFTGLLSDDQVYRVYRRHWIVLLRGLIWPLLLGTPLLLVLLALGAGEPGAAGLLLLLALIGLVAWVGYIVLDWRSDYLVVTDRRVLVNVERPGMRRERREVPLGKVQNIITQRGGILDRLLRNAFLVMDTSGLGRIIFQDIIEDAAAEARELILWLQKRSSAGALPSKELYRQQIIRSMLYGTPPPEKPRQIVVAPAPRSGYGLFNSLFPIRPQRDELTVVWHKHWWFLLKAERTPLLIFLGFELANIVIALAGNLAQVTENPLLGALAVARPFVYLVLLPMVWWQWENWRNDEYILTGDRLIDKETLPFGLQETVKETELRRVTDATITVDGIMPNLLRFGDVLIKTPGEATQFTFDGVPNPFGVQHEIMQRLEAQRENEQSQWDRDIQEWLRTYIEERRAEPAPNFPQQQPQDEWHLGW